MIRTKVFSVVLLLTATTLAHWAQAEMDPTSANGAQVDTHANLIKIIQRQIQMISPMEKLLTHAVMSNPSSGGSISKCNSAGINNNLKAACNSLESTKKDIDTLHSRVNSENQIIKTLTMTKATSGTVKEMEILPRSNPVPTSISLSNASGANVKFFDPPARPSYAYAASTFTLTDDNGTPLQYIFYCGGPETPILTGNDVKDFIRMRKNKWNGNHWEMMSDSIALSPGGTNWDKKHVCDPSVVRGKFKMNNQEYKWAMAYTGSNDQCEHGTHNHVGVAFSNDTFPNERTKWVKHPEVLIKGNAEAAPCRDPEGVRWPKGRIEDWGVGQPSLVSVDGNGSLMLFYTYGQNGRTETMAHHVDLSNTNAITTHHKWRVSTNGIGNGGFIKNADFIYDGDRDSFYMTRHSREDSVRRPNFIAIEEEISSLSGANMWSGKGNWKPLARINESLSGKAKNHNSGFVRNIYGHLPSRSPLLVVHFTTADNDDSWPGALNKYRIHEVRYKINSDRN